MKIIFTIIAILTSPALLWASEGSTVAAAVDFTSSVYGYLGVMLFVLAYSLVPLENSIHLRKSKPVILAAGIIWILVALAYNTIGDTHTAHEAIKHSLLEYAELFLFLLAAMTYINALEERNVFQALRVYLVSQGYSLRKIFWITGALAFVISPIADNLTTALLMGAVVMAVGAGNKKFVALACINIVVAANAGGAFSPFGDITTLMVWQKGKVAFGEFFAIFIPSLINWLIPAVFMNFAIENANPAANDEKIKLKFGALRIMFLFLATIFTAVSFHNFLHLPPAAGMMLGLGYLGIFSFYVKKVEGREGKYDSILGQRPHEDLHPLYPLINRKKGLFKFIQDYPDPTFVIDNDHLVTHWNTAMEKLSNVEAKDVIGTRRHWFPFYKRERLILADLVLENFSKEQIGKHYNGHHRALPNIQHAYETAAFFPDLSDEGKWLSISAAPIKDETGGVIGVVETLRDYTKHKDKASQFDLMKRIARAEWDTLLFFYGVILCVGGLSEFGYLGLVSGWLYTGLGDTIANSLVGVLSAIIDNIPVMFAVLTMDPEMSHGQWLLVTLTAGTGGSMLAVGSAAGVALMGAARGTYTFGVHLKWAPVIALGYVASILCHLFINAKSF
ncbi:MAG: sodium:proton antiporter NhaD [Desulfobacteraceae bacterium]|nr:sodium:proton antiporter NhaD [Desulfobacteraceae bacterium]